MKIEKNNIIRKASSINSQTNSLGSKAAKKEIEDEYDFPHIKVQQDINSRQKDDKYLHTFGYGQNNNEFDERSTLKEKDLPSINETPIINYQEVLNPEQGNYIITSINQNFSFFCNNEIL